MTGCPRAKITSGLFKELRFLQMGQSWTGKGRETDKEPFAGYVISSS